MKLKDWNKAKWLRDKATMQAELEKGIGIEAGAFKRLAKFERVRSMGNR